MHSLWATTLEYFLILPSSSSLSSRLVHLAVPCKRAIPDTWLALTLPPNPCSIKIPFWIWQDQNDMVLEMRVNHKFIHDDSPYPFPNNSWLPTFFFWQYVIPISLHCSKNQPRAHHFIHNVEAAPLSIHHFALPSVEQCSTSAGLELFLRLWWETLSKPDGCEDAQKWNQKISLAWHERGCFQRSRFIRS